jgi:integrase
MKLDAKSVAALKLGGKDDVIHFDDAMAGFGYRLRFGAGGKVLRSWVVQYKRAGATRRLLLGSAEVLGAEAARGAARKALAQIALGQDPQADRIDRRGKDQLTMRSQVAEFLAAKQSELADRSFVEIKRYLTDPRYFGPLFNLPIDAIHRKDIAARTVVIIRERGSPTAGRARSALGTFFTWCMRMGLTESNPTIGSVAPAAGEGRSRVLSDVELAAIWRSCGDDDHGRIIKLLILSACRRAEIGDMCWSELDDPERPSSFTIPANRSKNGKARTLPVTPTMARIIAGIPHMASRDQLFGMHSHGFTRWAGTKAELDARSGVENWVVHDIRRSTATKLADAGVQPHIVEEILGHSASGHKRGVAKIYNKSPYTNEVRNALLMWDDHVRTLVAGGARKVLAYTPATAS